MVIAHPTLTMEPAAGGLAENALGKHDLMAIMRVNAETYNSLIMAHNLLKLSSMH